MQVSMRIIAFKICSVFYLKYGSFPIKKHVLKRSASTGRTGRREVILPRHNFIFNSHVTYHFHKKNRP